MKIGQKWETREWSNAELFLLILQQNLTLNKFIKKLFSKEEYAILATLATKAQVFLKEMSPEEESEEVDESHFPKKYLCEKPNKKFHFFLFLYVSNSNCSNVQVLLFLCCVIIKRNVNIYKYNLLLITTIRTDI